MKLRYWILTLLIWIVLFKSSIKSPLFIENYYTHGLFRFMSKTLNSVFSLFPFSVGDILYTLLALLIGYQLLSIIRTKQKAKTKVLQIGSSFTKAIIAFTILFNLGWGLNNYKVRLENQLDLKYGYTQGELVELSKSLVLKANALQLEITGDSTTAVVVHTPVKDILQDAKLGLKKIEPIHKSKAVDHLAIKESLYSLPLTYMGFSGYINPFTLEGQVNAKIPTLTMIVTASHELSHQIGYAKESEANFIGFLATYHQEDKKYQYAAIIYALRYCLSTINKKESDNTHDFLETIHPGVRKNLIENIVFWEDYENITDSFFKLFYSNFLKLNNQKEGIESYNKFVDLLINYNLKYALIKD